MCESLEIASAWVSEVLNHGYAVLRKVLNDEEVKEVKDLFYTWKDSVPDFESAGKRIERSFPEVLSLEVELPQGEGEKPLRSSLPLDHQDAPGRKPEVHVGRQDKSQGEDISIQFKCFPGGADCARFHA